MTGEAQLEQLFGGKTAKILDHLSALKEFDFTLDELMKIYELDEETTRYYLKELLEFELIETHVSNDRTKFQLANNNRTKLLRKFQFEMAVWRFEKLTKEGDC